MFSGTSCEAQGHCCCVGDGNYFLHKEKATLIVWNEKVVNLVWIYSSCNQHRWKFVILFVNARLQRISSVTRCWRDEAGWAASQHVVGTGWETGPAASQAAARASCHPVAVVLLWRSRLKESSPAGLAAFLGPLSHHKSPTGLSGGGRQSKSEEQWEPQTTYPGIINACTIQGDAHCWDPMQALTSVRKFSDL